MQKWTRVVEWVPGIDLKLTKSPLKFLFPPPASSPTSAYFFMPQEPRQQQCRIMHATLLLKGEK